jgi:NADPH:quinone reductase-like Zn-dependent oxidoreductase
MNAYEFQTDGEVFRLSLVTRQPRPLGPNEVRIRVRACSLNYRDLIGWKNLAGRKLHGIIPCSDGAGEVIEVGTAVSRVQVGQAVAGCFFQTWHTGRFEMRHHQADLGGTVDGMLAREVILNEDGVVVVPSHLSFEEAACLPCAGLTAWYALMVRGQLQAGDTVLALGTGGVSVFALQLAKAARAKVLMTSSSDEKLERAKQLGADATLNYRENPNWEKEVHRLTDKLGVDHVVEVGGPGTLEKSLLSVKAGGHIALIGVLTGFGAPQTSLFPLVARNANISGIYVGPRDEFERMNLFLGEHQIHPVIDRIFPFEEAVEAFRYLDSGNHFGKVVVQMLPE